MELKINKVGKHMGNSSNYKHKAFTDSNEHNIGSNNKHNVNNIENSQDSSKHMEIECITELDAESDIMLQIIDKQNSVTAKVIEPWILSISSEIEEVECSVELQGQDKHQYEFIQLETNHHVQPCKRVMQGGYPNAWGAQIPLASVWNLKLFESLLGDYNDKEII